MILAGDIGGTHCRLALFRDAGGALEAVHEARYKSREFENFAAALEKFLAASKPGSLEKACFGIAGPVQDGRCQVTHLPWVVDVRDLRRTLKLETVALINDFAAQAAAVPFFNDADVAVVQAGEADPTGNIGILGAGTGLGQAILAPVGADSRYLLVESEGGHVDFPAQTPLEAELVQFLNKQYHRVCVEHVLSGAGLKSLYDFFQARHPEPPPEWLEAELKRGDPPEVISRVGLEQRFVPCEQALHQFVTTFGAVAGNLALQVVARGGIYIGGGIAPKILSLLQSDRFLEAFRDKHKFETWMRGIPVRVIVNDRCAVWGAAHYIHSDRFVRG
ncbi:glucokinase [Nitrospina watsonii]|uniref:Glucokinase n=1 Tax=Nitrospina watsonii TaxID=1323948 RepID=A0ABM9HCZ4_9BACT|nr:glucokinase [Nitrospina watsonii]CAI2718096.1 Glucokinase [Nitrospina watsonii]